MGSNEYPMSIKKNIKKLLQYPQCNIPRLSPLQVAGEAADAGAGGSHGRAGDGGDLGIAHLEAPRLKGRRIPRGSWRSTWIENP